MELNDQLIANATSKTGFDAISKSIIRLFLYYDIFRHPLSRDEIWKYFNSNLSKGELSLILARLKQEGYLSEFQGYLLLKEDPQIVVKKELGKIKADQLLQKAQKYSRYIAMLPFVESISISGSLSKFYADENSDIDYFIITKPNRLWLFRTFAGVLAKILILLRKQKDLCPNFIVTSDNLLIENKNILSATELVTLLPVYGHAVYLQLKEKNKWIGKYYEHCNWVDLNYTIEIRPNTIEKILKFIDNWKAWKYLDDLCYYSHKWYYDKKYKDEDKQNVNYSKAHYKMHPVKHRTSIISQYRLAIEKFEHVHGLDLDAKY